MPFTVSHPAAVLLVARTGLPIGAMAPDVPMFIPVPGSYAVTHSLLGVLTVDVVMGVLGLFGWLHLVRDALVDVAPAAVRERLAVTARYSRSQWRLVPAGVALGALTHVVWDAFTHPHRWGAEHIGWLREAHGGLLGSAWAQYASGAIGALVVGTWALGFLSAQERRHRSPLVPDLGVDALAVVMLAAATFTGVATLSAASDGLRAMALRCAVLGTVATVVGVLALAVTWQSRADASTRAP